MSKKIYFILFILFSGCSSKYTIDAKKFGEYVNDYHQSDGRTDELLFKLNVPKKIEHVTYSRSKAAHFHLIDLNNEQKIAIIQLVGKDKDATTKQYALSYMQFENICKKENIFNEIQNVFKINNDRHRLPVPDHFITGRYFGINKTGDGLYVLYINVKHKNIADYNYYINSISY